MKKNIFFAYALIWVAVAIAAIIGMVVTKDPICLCAFVFPWFAKPEIWKNDDRKIWCEDNKKDKVE